MYTLHIERMEEKDHTYYLGEVKELRGLFVYGKSEQEVKEIAPSLINDYLEVEEKMKKQKHLTKDSVHNVNFKLV